MKRIHGNQSGDTIVEVLIAIAIVSLVLAGAYVSTNRNTQSIQDAQERGQALKLVESQIELLKANNGTPNALIIPGSPPTAHDCFDPHSNTPKDDNGTHGLGTNNCEFDSSGQKAAAGIQPVYRLAMTSNAATPATYTIKATWDGISGGQDQVILYYRPD